MGTKREMTCPEYYEQPYYLNTVFDTKPAKALFDATGTVMRRPGKSFTYECMMHEGYSHEHYFSNEIWLRLHAETGNNTHLPSSRQMSRLTFAPDMMWMYMAYRKYVDKEWLPTYLHDQPWFRNSPQFITDFLHVSKTDKEMVSYIPDSLKGSRLLATKVKVGRYMSKYLGLSPNIVKQEVENFRRYHELNAQDVKFAKTSEEIVKVYQTGPYSCMANPTHLREQHPTIVYAGPDTSLAYVLNKLGNVQQRAVVCTKDKTFVRIYGEGPLLERLTALGYRQLGRWDPNNPFRIRRVRTGPGMCLMPYIDGAGTAYLIESDPGHYYIGGVPRNSRQLASWNCQTTATYISDNYSDGPVATSGESIINIQGAAA